jgi:hypothetical protein
MNTSNDRRRAPFLGLPVFEMFFMSLFLMAATISFIGPVLRWLFR